MLTEQKIHQLLNELPKWKLEKEQLTRNIKFQDFLDSMGFLNRLLPICEEMNHHPDIHLSYNRLELNLYTHSANALTELDFILAKTIENLLNEWPTLKDGH